MSAPFRLTDTITYWAPQGWDGYGSKTFAAPVTISGRWEVVRKLVTDQQGNDVMSVAQVAVDQDVLNDGYLYPGDATGSANPLQVDGAYRIVAFESARSLVRNRTYRKATVGQS